MTVLLFGCATGSMARGSMARAKAAGELLEEGVKAHNSGQLSVAAAAYERLLWFFPEEDHACAQALRSLGNIRVAQDRLESAIQLYRRVGEKYPGQDWEVLQAWKSAGDLLWDAGRQDEARKFYRQIVLRFDQPDAPAVFRTIVQAANHRLG